MKLDISIYKNRRDDLLNKIGDALAIIFNNQHVPRNRDSEYKFRSDSYFHYFYLERKHFHFMDTDSLSRFCQTYFNISRFYLKFK